MKPSKYRPVVWSFCGVVAVVLGVSANAIAQPKLAISEDYTDDQIAQLYLHLALGSEFAVLDSKYNTERIVKRDQSRPVNIIAIPQPSVPIHETISMVNDVAGDIQRHSDDVEFRLYDEDGILNFINRDQSDLLDVFQDTVAIYVGSKVEIEGAIEKAASVTPEVAEIYMGVAPQVAAGKPLCLGVSFRRWDRPQFIGKSLVWVEYGPNLRECLYEEIMQSFGIANDFPVGVASIFNDDAVLKTPTPLDWELWRLHMHPRIQAGMQVEQVKNIIEEIIDGGEWP